LKAVRLDPKEVEYCSTLNWESLMLYLKEKYGIPFQEQFKKQLTDEIQNKMKLSNEEKGRLK
jgi:hypothetical protein